MLGTCYGELPSYDCDSERDFSVGFPQTGKWWKYGNYNYNKCLKVNFLHTCIVVATFLYSFDLSQLPALSNKEIFLQEVLEILKHSLQDYLKSYRRFNLSITLWYIPVIELIVAYFGL